MYGQLIPTYHTSGEAATSVQHAGFGSKLMRRAELIAMSHQMYKMAVIAGVGTRDYYRKLGYRYDDDGGFLVKDLDSSTTDWTSFLVAASGVRWEPLAKTRSRDVDDSKSYVLLRP